MNLGNISDTNLKQVIVYLYEQGLRTRIDIQVILQLMIKHEITTVEEVQSMRSYLEKQPIYKTQLDILKNMNKELDEDEKFENLVIKSLSGDRNEPISSKLTSEEREYLLSRLKGVI